MVPRRTQLTPLESDILWLLEEAGAESIGTILSDIGVRNALLSHQEVLMSTAHALRRLSRLGLIEIDGPDLTHGIESVVWNDKAQCWESNQGRLPSVVLTRQGASFLES